MRFSTLLAVARNRRTLLRGLTEDALAGLNRRPNAVLPMGEVKTILDAGGGEETGSVLPLLNFGRHEAIHSIRANIDRNARPDLIADLAAAWPCRPNRIDLILGTWVLEHVLHPETFLREAYQALRPGGVLLLTVPFIYFKHASPVDYYRFTDDSLRALLQAQGFHIETVRPVGGGPFLAATSLLWPILHLVPILPVLAAFIADRLVGGLTRLLHRGEWLTEAYPLAFIVVAGRPALSDATPRPPGGLGPRRLSRSGRHSTLK